MEFCIISPWFCIISPLFCIISPKYLLEGESLINRFLTDNAQSEKKEAGDCLSFPINEHTTNFTENDVVDVILVSV